MPEPLQGQTDECDLIESYLANDLFYSGNLA